MAKVCRNGEVFVNQTPSICLSETWEREEGISIREAIPNESEGILAV